MKKVLFLGVSIFYFLSASCFESFVASDKSVKETSDKNYGYDVNFYFIDIEISKESTNVIGNVLIEAKVLDEKLNLLRFDVDSQLFVDSVFVNDVLVQFSRAKHTLSLLLDEPIDFGNYFRVKFYYHGNAYSESTRGGVFNRLSTFNTPVTYSLTEPFSAKAWMPCKEDLHDKADSVYVRITAPDSMLVGSNGLLHEVVGLENGKTRFEWRSYYPIAFYLISFSAGYYRDYTFYASIINSSDSFPVVNYIYDDDNYFSNNRESIDATKDLFKCFNKNFGMYPFYKEKYGHCVAPLGGGMEHQTMTTLGGFNFDLVAHELAHQWFGNNVTCSSWQDIWINEGFASYSEYIANEFVRSAEDASSWMAEAHENAKGAKQGSVYVPLNEIDDQKRIFNYALSYQKGASIIHMIRREIQNDSLFFEILKEFQRKFAFDVASGNDFRLLLDSMSGKSFETFFQEWYFGEGYPEMEIYWQKRPDTLYIINKQKPTAPAKTPLFSILVDYKIRFLDWDTTITVRQQSLIDTIKIPISERVIGVVTDPDNWLLKNILLEQELDFKASQDMFLIYPNPATDELVIESRDTLLSFRAEIFSANGNVLLIKDQIKHYIRINTSDFPVGLYVVRVTTSDVWKAPVSF